MTTADNVPNNQELRRTLYQAAIDIAQTHPAYRAGWIAYLLETLEIELNPHGDAFVKKAYEDWLKTLLDDAIYQRIKNHSW